MQVVMLSDFETVGGAAIGAGRLAEGLIRAGVQVTRLVAYPDGQIHPWTTQLLRGRLKERLAWELFQRMSRRISMRLAICTQILWVHWTLHVLLKKLRPDVINVHNLHGSGWWPNLVAVCVRHAPTVWTLQDMWSFTGRCAYSYECRKFVSGCDASCPTPNEYPALAPRLIASSWKLRRRLLSTHPELVAVCVSDWLAKEALTGLWKGHRIEVIPNGVPLELYKPFDRKFARAALDIDAKGPVLLVSAHNMEGRRKGGGILVEALEKVLHRPFTVVTMGQGSLPIRSEGIHLYSLGYINHERTRMLAYNAADVAVHPAPVEALGQVIIEAMACGTPVVGFPVGGVVDVIRCGQTGWLAEAVTPGALATAIGQAIRELQAGVDLSSSCRAVTEAEYSIELQARRYLELFKSLGV